jgi:hypothetical protein
VLCIGIDEAGLGPNLGPLVVTAARWQLPGEYLSGRFEQWLAAVVSSAGTAGGTRLHVADSKQVHSSSGGIAALERSALALLAWGGVSPGSVGGLIRQLTGATDDQLLAGECWWPGDDVSLPRSIPAEEITSWSEKLREVAAGQGLSRPEFRSDVVFPDRFNRLLDECDNKSLVLSRVSLQLLRRVWNPGESCPGLVISDKHGGRNRYGELLRELTGEEFLFTLEEGPQCSRYRVRETELRFQAGGEQHFPVAAASLISKYMREVVLEAFNQFWIGQLPGLRPTKGYPVDARRFREEVEELRRQLGIPEEHFWRRK